MKLLVKCPFCPLWYRLVGSCCSQWLHEMVHAGLLLPTVRTNRSQVQMATALSCAPGSGGSGREFAVPARRRLALQSATAASSTSSTAARVHEAPFQVLELDPRVSQCQLRGRGSRPQRGTCCSSRSSSSNSVA
jgi:hypothetical protein